MGSDGGDLLVGAGGDGNDVLGGDNDPSVVPIAEHGYDNWIYRTILRRAA
ncbi:MAG: hypothetical protein HQL10_12305 [Nitrospirae bacterium]|nr:hypothetical protein [Nitrospirota bacterium]